MKTKFLSVCLGVAAVLFALGFVIHSVNPAQAAPAPQAFIEEGTSKIGKYMITVINQESTEYYETVIVWDTETGTSTRYARKATGYEKTTQQLPESPVK